MTESYILAIDIGTSRVAAAVARTGADQRIDTQAVPLGRHSDSAPSLVFVAEGELLFGDAADRRGLARPDRLVRDLKRRIGDDVPLIIGEQRFSPEQLYARMAAWVIATATEREGARPAWVIVTVPVNWGGYRVELIEDALAREGWPEIDVITEPEAAIRHYEATRPLKPGAVVGVYDLGGGTFDAAIVHRAVEGESRVAVIGRPVGLDAFGGADFDVAVLRHTLDAVGLTGLDDDPDAGTRIALAALRRECVDAKEALSFDSETVVPVMIERRRTVRVVRSEFEAMIEPGIRRTIDAFDDALESAGVEAAELDAILLTGGSSRIPRIAQLLSQEYDRPLAVDADPKAIIALGAARDAARRRLHPRPDAGSAAAAAAVAALPAPFVRGPRPTKKARPGGRPRVGIGPIMGIAAGALVLAAGIATSTGFPFSAAADGTTPRSSESPAPSSTPTPTVAPDEAALTDERPGDSLVIPRSTAPAEEPLLVPAAPSDRIQNSDPAPEPDATDPSSLD